MTRVIYKILPFILCLILVVPVCGCGKKEDAAPTTQALDVKVTRIKKGELSLPIEFVGQTKGAVDAEVRARVEGVILGVHFNEGKEVKEGDPLYTIDPAPFQAKVAEAQAKVAEAKTHLTKAQADLARIRPLAEMRAVSQKDLDAAIAQEGVANGSVDAANANLEAAKIELGYTKIAAPISGMIGLSKAKVGEFVGRSPNPVVLTTVSQLDPIHVRFGVTEKDYLYFARLRQKQRDAGETPEDFKLSLELSDGSVHPQTGGIASVDSQIDPSTGSLTVEATFPNPGKIIRPGQYGKVKTIGETLKNAIVVPKAAIREIQGTQQIAVVNSSNTIEVKNIKTGREIGSDVEVTSGLSEGDLIVPEAQQRLKTGTLVNPIVQG